MPRSTNILFSVFSFLIGFGMASLGLRSLIKVWYLERKGIRTIGRIIDISDTDKESGTLPVIEYVTLNGEVVQKKSEVYYYQVKLGQEISLIYDEQTHYMIHDSFTHKYMTGIFLLLLGMAFMTVPATIKAQA